MQAGVAFYECVVEKTKYAQAYFVNMVKSKTRAGAAFYERVAYE